jgi:hypothetical protein
MLCFGRSVAMSDSRVSTPLSCLSGTAEEFEAKPRRSRIKLVERTDAVQTCARISSDVSRKEG